MQAKSAVSIFFLPAFLALLPLLCASSERLEWEHPRSSLQPAVLVSDDLVVNNSAAHVDPIAAVADSQSSPIGGFEFSCPVYTSWACCSTGHCAQECGPYRNCTCCSEQCRCTLCPTGFVLSPTTGQCQPCRGVQYTALKTKRASAALLRGDGSWTAVPLTPFGFFAPADGNATSIGQLLEEVGVRVESGDEGFLLSHSLQIVANITLNVEGAVALSKRGIRLDKVDALLSASLPPACFLDSDKKVLNLTALLSANSSSPSSPPTSCLPGTSNMTELVRAALEVTSAPLEGLYPAEVGMAQWWLDVIGEVSFHVATSLIGGSMGGVVDPTNITAGLDSLLLSFNASDAMNASGVGLYLLHDSTPASSAATMLDDLDSICSGHGVCEADPDAASPLPSPEGQLEGESEAAAGVTRRLNSGRVADIIRIVDRPYKFAIDSPPFARCLCSAGYSGVACSLECGGKVELSFRFSSLPLSSGGEKGGGVEGVRVNATSLVGGIETMFALANASTSNSTTSVEGVEKVVADVLSVGRASLSSILPSSFSSISLVRDHTLGELWSEKSGKTKKLWFGRAQSPYCSARGQCRASAVQGEVRCECEEGYGGNACSECMPGFVKTQVVMVEYDEVLHTFAHRVDYLCRKCPGYRQLPSGDVEVCGAVGVCAEGLGLVDDYHLNSSSHHISAFLTSLQHENVTYAAEQARAYLTSSSLPLHLPAEEHSFFQQYASQHNASAVEVVPFSTEAEMMENATRLLPLPAVMFSSFEGESTYFDWMKSYLDEGRTFNLSTFSSSSSTSTSTSTSAGDSSSGGEVGGGSVMSAFVTSLEKRLCRTVSEDTNSVVCAAFDLRVLSLSSLCPALFLSLRRDGEGVIGERQSGSEESGDTASAFVVSVRHYLPAEWSNERVAIALQLAAECQTEAGVLASGFSSVLQGIPEPAQQVAMVGALWMLAPAVVAATRKQSAPISTFPTCICPSSFRGRACEKVCPGAFTAAGDLPIGLATSRLLFSRRSDPPLLRSFISSLRLEADRRYPDSADTPRKGVFGSVPSSISNRMPEKEWYGRDEEWKHADHRVGGVPLLPSIMWRSRVYSTFRRSSSLTGGGMEEEGGAVTYSCFGHGVCTEGVQVSSVIDISDVWEREGVRSEAEAILPAGMNTTELSSVGQAACTCVSEYESGDCSACAGGYVRPPHESYRGTALLPYEEEQRRRSPCKRCSTATQLCRSLPLGCCLVQ